MKRFNYYIIFLVLLGLVSCDEGLLEPNYDGSLKSEQVWSDPDFAQGVLIQAYNALPGSYSHYNGQFLDVATDNAVTNQYDAPLYNVATGGWQPNANPIGSWNNDYQQLYHINLFLEKGLDAPYSLVSEVKRQEIANRLKGEALFLRAYYHFKLLRDYAGPNASGEILGVPLVTKPLEPEELFKPRASYQACVEQIVADCDSAAAYLPQEYTGENQWLSENQTGRATSIAAMALKSRTLLYSASPAYNTDGDPQKWVDAAEASYQAIQVIGGNLPEISYENPSGFYHDPNHPELIMRNYGTHNWMENNNFMPLLYGQGQTNPSHNLAQAFPMANGYPIDHSSSGYDPQNPYQNRDPRFYATLLHNEARFSDTTVQTYTGGRDAAGSTVHSTRTGYYLRKWMSETVTLKPGETNNDKHYYALFRKGELFLNFAEAANEAWGPQTAGGSVGMTAEEAMQEHWDRVGYESSVPLEIAALKGQEDFRALIHNQRRLEFAFENHRYYDLRRWMVPHDQLAAPVQGVEISESGNSYDTYVVEERDFKEYMYYGPLPYDEVVKNDQLVQNAGW